MIATYLISLIVGGTLVSLSALGGLRLGSDVDADMDADIDADVDVDADIDVDVDVDADLGGGLDMGASADAGGLGETALLGNEAKSRAPRRLWLPFYSMRFWTFGSAFFGLTGVTLHQLSTMQEPQIAMSALSVGALTGTAISYLVRQLRQPVGATLGEDAWIGTIGELLFSVEGRGITKIRVHQPGRPARDLLASLTPTSPSLPKGARVVVLAFEDGKALIEGASPAMLDAYAPTASHHHQPSTQEEDA